MSLKTTHLTSVHAKYDTRIFVKEFFTMIHDFGHKETGKYLDLKM